MYVDIILNVHCPLSNVHCPLSIVHCPLSIVHCPFFRCPLSIVHCEQRELYIIPQGKQFSLPRFTLGNSVTISFLQQLPALATEAGAASSKVSKSSLYWQMLEDIFSMVKEQEVQSVRSLGVVMKDPLADTEPPQVAVSTAISVQ